MNIRKKIKLYSDNVITKKFQKIQKIYKLYNI